MSVSQRGSSWQATVRWPGAPSGKLRRSFKSQADALRWEAEALERISRGESPEAAPDPQETGWTLQSLLDATVARFWAGTSNEDRATSNAQEVIDILGPNKRPQDVTPLELDRVIADLRKRNNGDATINRKMAALGKMLTYAQTRGIIKAKPAIERFRESEGRLRWYTPEEEARVLNHLKEVGDTDFADLVVFLIDVGCRPSEAVACRWMDADDAHVRFFDTKNGKRRGVPLTSRVRAILNRRRMAGGDGPFTDWTVTSASHSWTDYRRALGFDEEAVLYSLRHTCASRLAQAGTPIQLIKQWLGHKNIQQTEKYSHLAPCNLTAAVSALEKAAPQTAPAKTEEGDKKAVG